MEVGIVHIERQWYLRVEPAIEQYGVQAVKRGEVHGKYASGAYAAVGLDGIPEHTLEPNASRCSVARNGSAE